MLGILYKIWHLKKKLTAQNSKNTYLPFWKKTYDPRPNFSLILETR
jgi:hypothetical protein